MFILGITGGIGSGKSTFASFLTEAGLPVLDADKISHEMTSANGRSMPEIKELFGEEVLHPDGSLNRKVMAKLIFQDKKSLDLLSAIVHEDVIARMSELTDELAQKKASAVVLDVPIPVKKGFLDQCDVVVCIWADDDIRIERLLKRGLSRDEAQRRIDVQMTKEEYAKISHYMFMNNGGFAELKEKAELLLKSELGSRGIPYLSLVE